MALDTSYFGTGTVPTGTTTTRSVFPAYGTNLQNPNEMVQEAMGAALDPNSSYIRNARQRGLEVAASRGGINSSIAAGASERAAIEAAAPLAQQSLDIQKNRESIQAQDWITQQNFQRGMMQMFTQGAFDSTRSMLDSVMQYSLDDPELYTPDVVSGYSNFFVSNMQNIFSRFFTNSGG